MKPDSPGRYPNEYGGVAPANRREIGETRRNTTATDHQCRRRDAAGVDMFLSHIDEAGNAALPVLVDRVRKESRVINYPEFVNRDPDKPFSMEYDFVEIAHIDKAVKSGDIEKAKKLFAKFEAQDLHLFREDCEQLSDLLDKMGMRKEAAKYRDLAAHTTNADLFKD